MKKWLFIIAGLVIVGIWQLSLLYEDVFAEQMNAEDQAAERAADAFNLTSIDNVSFYHGDKAYFVVKGSTKEDTTLFVWVPEKKGKLIKRQAKEGWSKQKVKQYIKKTEEVKEMIDIHPGLIKDVPIWEVVYIDQKGNYVIHQLTYNDGDKVVIYRL